ncbi:hypothetical protein IW261DRAFT_1650626 [Armillaria novae-zelandiae]|uniref:Uncharacterized protein n=1 Tax=Armillaria novae-zelandiae TaxID=153914 RepID=A0AA39NYD6_9AGAR|nr:hypothetical protein IW261DRAFT_1650626 [Armillaria novae-zelandiae]
MSWNSLHGAVSSGTLLATSWLNVLLYTAQVSLSVYYLYHFSASRWLRYWISASLVLDGACSIVVMASTYMYLINSHGPLQPTFTWTVPTIELLTYSSATIVQAFFCYRHWTIARNKWITGWIIVLIVAYMILNLVSTIHVIIYPMALVPAIPLIVSGICALTDLTIAFSLACTCLRIETPYTSTKNVLRRVIVQALTCGFTTAISTTLMTIFLFVVWNACYSLFSVLGRIYSLTVLSTLILLKVMHRSDPSTRRMDGEGSASENPVALATICFKHTSGTETTGDFTHISSEVSDHRPTLRNLAHDQPLAHTV